MTSLFFLDKATFSCLSFKRKTYNFINGSLRCSVPLCALVRGWKTICISVLLILHCDISFYPIRPIPYLLPHTDVEFIPILCLTRNSLKGVHSVPGCLSTLNGQVIRSCFKLSVEERMPKLIKSKRRIPPFFQKYGHYTSGIRQWKYSTLNSSTSLLFTVS